MERKKLKKFKKSWKWIAKLELRELMGENNLKKIIEEKEKENSESRDIEEKTFKKIQSVEKMENEKLKMSGNYRKNHLKKFRILI